MGLEPNREGFGQLDNNTEICVSPKKRQQSKLSFLQGLFGTKEASQEHEMHHHKRLHLMGKSLRIVCAAEFGRHPFCCYVACRVTQTPELIDIVKVSMGSESEWTVKVKVHFCLTESSLERPASTLYMSPVLFSGLNLSLGDQVFVKHCQPNFPLKASGKLKVFGSDNRQVHDFFIIFLANVKFSFTEADKP